MDTKQIAALDRAMARLLGLSADELSSLMHVQKHAGVFNTIEKISRAFETARVTYTRQSFILHTTPRIRVSTKESVFHNDNSELQWAA